jgi:alkylhydroperoxidase/carboxymuconolactone decarboxylase family protein YurZ
LRYVCCQSKVNRRSWHPPPAIAYARGKDYFTTLYSEKHASRIITNMAATHPDLPIFAINHLYTGAISDVTVLDSASSALVNFSSTVATDSGPQAKGHIHGCRNFGVEKWEIQSALKVVTAIAEEVRKAGGGKIRWETMGFIQRFGGMVPTEEGWEDWVWKEDDVRAKL